MESRAVYGNLAEHSQWIVEVFSANFYLPYELCQSLSHPAVSRTSPPPPNLPGVGRLLEVQANKAGRGGGVGWQMQSWVDFQSLHSKQKLAQETYRNQAIIFHFNHTQN